ncbi:MAG: hypothetical protein M0P49_06870 [Bacilli bacterium]|nr:hypothetical protein [Bacilli bacterium]
MEKCEACNKNLFIDSRSEQKRVDIFKEKTGNVFCSSCRKRYEKEQIGNAVQDVIFGAMGRVMGKGHYPFFGG